MVYIELHNIVKNNLPNTALSLPRRPNSITLIARFPLLGMGPIPRMALINIRRRLVPRTSFIIMPKARSDHEDHPYKLRLKCNTSENKNLVVFISRLHRSQTLVQEPITLETWLHKSQTSVCRPITL